MSCQAEYNFPCIKKGTTFDEVNLDFSVNITGATIIMKFKEGNNAPTAFEFTTENNTITILDGTLGTARMNSRLMNYREGIYKYDCLIIFSDLTRKIYFGGTIEIYDKISE